MVTGSNAKLSHLCFITEGDLKEGDVLLTNHPVGGGSHLPDCTVITPVFQDGEIVFFTASRGHHAGELCCCHCLGTLLLS